MKSKKFAQCFFMVSFLLIILDVFINYKLDMYGIFDKDFSKPKYTFLNERYAKVDYIVNKDNGQHDTFIFGSSRARGIDPSLISESTYNLAYVAGLPVEYIADLKTLLANKVYVKKIYLALDDFSYKRVIEEVGASDNCVHYGTWNENLKYKASLLLSFPNKEKIRRLQNRLNASQEMYYINYNGSRERKIKRLSDFTNDYTQYITDDKFTKPTFYAEKLARIDGVVEEIKNIKQICNDHDIELVIFFTPTHITSYLSDDIGNLNEFKRKVAEVSNFYDFSDINTITKNNMFWLETSHTFPYVSDMVVKVLLNQRDDTIPDDFGVYITKENVNEWLQLKLFEYREYDKKS